MNQENRIHEPTEEMRDKAKGDILKLLARGYFIEEVKQHIESEYNVTGQAAGQWTHDVFNSLAEKAQTNVDHNLAIQQIRYEMMLNQLWEKEVKNDKDWKLILKIMERLDRIGALEGPKAINTFQFNLNQQNNAVGADAPYPVITDKSDEELIEEAKRRGLKAPDEDAVERTLRDKAKEAGAQGESVMVSKEDAQRLITRNGKTD